MKKLLILILFTIISLVSVSQTLYYSDYCGFKVKPIGGEYDELKIETKDRVIILGDELITISRFMHGEITQAFKVVKIDIDENVNKTYYCVSFNNGILPDLQNITIWKVKNILVLTFPTNTQTLQIRFNLKYQ